MISALDRCDEKEALRDNRRAYFSRIDAIAS
jgi:hypothetical protein